MQSVFRLFSPLSYLRIRHKVKVIYDWLLPIILATICTLAYWRLPYKPALYGTNGFISYISDIIKFLSPFYIASLAAISTFSNENIDETMIGDPCLLKTKIKNNSKNIELTRRQFLCYLFGYLSLISLFLYFFAYIADISRQNIAHCIPVDIQIYIKYLFIWFYLFCFYNMIISTLLGLHYLSNRIHKSK